MLKASVVQPLASEYGVVRKRSLSFKIRGLNPNVVFIFFGGFQRAFITVPQAGCRRNGIDRSAWSVA